MLLQCGGFIAFDPTQAHQRIHDPGRLRSGLAALVAHPKHLVDRAELAAPLAFRVARAAVQKAGVVERHLDGVRDERWVRVRDRLEIDRRLPLVDQTVVDAKLGKPAEDDGLRLLPGLPI